MTSFRPPRALFRPCLVTLLVALQVKAVLSGKGDTTGMDWQANTYVGHETVENQTDMAFMVQIYRSVQGSV